MRAVNFQMFKLVLEKAEGPEIKLPASIRILNKAGEFQKKIYFCFSDYAKAFGYVDPHKLWKILRDGNTRPPDLSLESLSPCGLWPARLLCQVEGFSRQD